MVLRAGYKDGPARPWDQVGAASGGLAVIVLGVFVLAAPRQGGYSSFHDTISQLGAYGSPGRWWFTAVNILEAVLIALFAYGVQRRVAISLLGVLLLAGIAPGSLAVGLFPCSDPCSPRTFSAHTVAASYSAVLILLMMLAVGWGAWRNARGRWVCPATLACSAANLVAFVVLMVAIYGSLGGIGLWERLFWATAYLWVAVATAAIIEATLRVPAVPAIDPVKLQTKIVRSSRSWTEAAYLVGSVIDPHRARQWIGHLVAEGGPVVGDADWAGDQPPRSVTVAFTDKGLRALEIGYHGTDSQAFTDGMRTRSDILGDDGDSAPEYWQDPWRSPVDLLVWIEGTDGDEVEAAVSEVASLDGSDGVRFHPPLRAGTAATRGELPIEPLGFTDGISQPPVALDGRSVGPQTSGPAGALNSHGRWRPVAAGEFVLGVTDESGATAPLPDPPEVFQHGSFLVVRKLEERVDPGLDREFAARTRPMRVSFTELLVGRLRSRPGWPLEPVAGADDPNQFDYASDPEGRYCPLGAHIRRANPRDALGFGTLLSARHRIIRRGKPFRDGAGPEPSQGLMFVAVNARIEDQFEFVQRVWLNDGNRQRVGATADAIAGHRTGRLPVILQSDAGPEVCPEVPQLTRTLGGEYFFAPSINGLRAIATG
jgi:Dyp-type peroxidase family